MLSLRPSPHGLATQKTNIDKYEDGFYVVIFILAAVRT
jgi:hypothetical protein